MILCPIHFKIIYDLKSDFKINWNHHCLLKNNQGCKIQNEFKGIVSGTKDISWDVNVIGNKMRACTRLIVMTVMLVLSQLNSDLFES